MILLSLLPSSLAVLSLLQGTLVSSANAFQTASSRTSLHLPKVGQSGASFVHQNRHPIATTYLQSSTTSNEDPYASPQLDTSAIAKYIIAGITELGLFSATFQLLDMAQASLDTKLPFPAIAFLFYACSLKSRVFNPLNNQRPDRSKAIDGEGSSGFRDRVMPSWTPPGKYIFSTRCIYYLVCVWFHTSKLIICNIQQNQTYIILLKELYSP